jgi:hypothetical protein
MSIPFAIEYSPKKIKKMIMEVAEPQPNNKRHESGAGYIDVNIFSNYISNFGLRICQDIF